MSARQFEIPAQMAFGAPRKTYRYEFKSCLMYWRIGAHGDRYRKVYRIAFL